MMVYCIYFLLLLIEEKVIDKVNLPNITWPPGDEWFVKFDYLREDDIAPTNYPKLLLSYKPTLTSWDVYTDV